MRKQYTKLTTNLKNNLGFILLLIIIPFLAWEKENTYSFSEPQAIQVYQLMDVLKQEIPKSNISFKEGIAILNSADSIQKIIQIQYNKFHKDSTSKK